MQIDVIIPICNAERFLSDCLQSVQKQSYRNWRAILVDDGSTDASGKIADGFSENDERFMVFHKANEGQFAARLTGLSLAEGDVFLFLDADDQWDPDCLKEVVDAFRSKQVDVVLFPANVVDAEGNLLHRIGEVAPNSAYVKKKVLYESILSTNALNSLCLKAFRRELLDVPAMQRDHIPQLRMGEDKIMMLPLMTKANAFYYLNKTLYTYVRNDNGISHSHCAANIEKMIPTAMFQKLGEYMRRWDMDDAKHRRRLEEYYLRDLMNCYFRTKKSCKTAEDRRVFKEYRWRACLPADAWKRTICSKLSWKEKVKLMLMEFAV